jgi:hypothetical protein
VKRDPETLLSAWAHEPRALTLEERAEVEALLERSPELRREADDARALLARVRALPAEGQEPEWDEFARSLRAKLDEPPRGFAAWWRRWWKPAAGVGGLGLAIAAAAIVIVARREPADETSPPVARTVDAGVPPPPIQVAEEDHSDDPLALGAVGEVSADELDDSVLAELELDDDDDGEEGLVPDLDLAWIDQLDDDEVESVDAWLAQM